MQIYDDEKDVEKDNKCNHRHEEKNNLIDNGKEFYMEKKSSEQRKEAY